MTTTSRSCLTRFRHGSHRSSRTCPTLTAPPCSGIMWAAPSREIDTTATGLRHLLTGLCTISVHLGKEGYALKYPCRMCVITNRALSLQESLARGAGETLQKGTIIDVADPEICHPNSRSLPIVSPNAGSAVGGRSASRVLRSSVAHCVAIGRVWRGGVRSTEQ